MEFLRSLNQHLAEKSGSRSSTTVDVDIFPKSPPTCELSSALDALHAAVVMEMLVDELDILSSTINAGQPELRTQGSIELDHREHRPVYMLSQEGPGYKPGFTLAQRYSSVIPRRMFEGLDKMKYWSSSHYLSLATGAKVKGETAGGKFQIHRTFMHVIADNTLRELIQTGSFEQLYDVVQTERATLKKFWDTCDRLTKDQVKIAKLKRQKVIVRREKQKACTELNDEIFKLMDQGLELDKRIELENNLAQKQVVMVVKRFKRLHRQVLYVHHKIIADWHKRITNEFKVHMQIYAYLTKVLDERNVLLNYWTDKYEGDLAHLITSLEELVAERYKDTMRAIYLRAKIARWYPVVCEDRRLKAIEASKVEQTHRENRCAVKIQAWWRGTMVRNELGPYRKGITKPKKDGEKAKEKDKKKK